VAREIALANGFRHDKLKRNNLEFNDRDGDSNAKQELTSTVLDYENVYP